MLVSGGVRHERLFASVRAVVIDEVHAFAADDRGWHLLALLQRVARLAGRDLQRLGLSATVGNPEDLLRWLAAGSGRPGRVVRPESLDAAEAEVVVDDVGGRDNAARVIAALHRGEKRLVVCDSRSRVEELGAERRGRGVETFVTHSSLSANEGRAAEGAFAGGRNCVIVATSALELDIDVGEIDRVIPIDAPAGVASFLQRMGRTGRRPGFRRNCLSLATTDEGLLRAAGLMRLGARGHVEEVKPPPRPAHILVQQLMALARQEGGIARCEWLSWVEAVPAFRALPPGEIDALVAWMLDSKILWEEGILWLGREGQDAYGRKNFLELFSVFTAPPEVRVLHGQQELGFVHDSTFLARQDGGPTVLLLAGRSWRLTHLD
jgi:ATP-dependent Lhr-like helicase